MTQYIYAATVDKKACSMTFEYATSRQDGSVTISSETTVYPSEHILRQEITRRIRSLRNLAEQFQ